MCLSPLNITNRSTYPSLDFGMASYLVPCGRCLECRSGVQSEWRTRISFEIDSLYRRGGTAIFLTFTYSDKCLPIYEDGDFRISCFNHDDVLTFLNRLKVRSYRAFGKNSYKYFFTSEYGKNTKRPHYHAIFFLQPNVNYLQFARICQDVWTYGFMFPKYSKSHKCFIDNDGNMSEIRIRSLVGGAKYVSKYATKDLSFYEIPDVSRYLSSPNAFKLKKYLPKHWQSNLLGLSAIDNVNLFDTQEIERLLDSGIMNPLTMKYEPLPRFILNRLLYKNVFTGRYNGEGRKLYDRHLTHFGWYYFRKVWYSRIRKTTDKVKSVLSSIDNGTLMVDVPLPPRFGFNLDDVSYRISFFHHLWCSVNKDVIVNFLLSQDGNFDDMFNIDATFRVYLHTKDSLFLKLHPSVFTDSCKLDFPNIDLFCRDLFKSLDAWHYVYMYVSTKQRFERLKDSDYKSQQLDLLRSRYMFKFNKNYC